MPTKRAHISRSEAYSLFIKAFDLAHIDYSHEHDAEGRQSVKPQAGWYKSLSGEINSLYPQTQAFHNYPNYLKDRYNDIKRHLYVEDDQFFRFDVQLMQPLWDYAQQNFDHADKREFYATVLFTEKRYSWLNIWRLPDPRRLIRFREHLLLEGETKTTLSLPITCSTISMPPLPGQWLVVSNERTTCYLAVSDGHSKLTDIASLRDFLSVS